MYLQELFVFLYHILYGLLRCDDFQLLLLSLTKWLYWHMEIQTILNPLLFKAKEK